MYWYKAMVRTSAKLGKPYPPTGRGNQLSTKTKKSKAYEKDLAP